MSVTCGIGALCAGETLVAAVCADDTDAEGRRFEAGVNTGSEVNGELGADGFARVCAAGGLMGGW